MSSPKVMTTHPAPIDECIASNRESCEQYISLCREAWSRLRRRAAALAAVGRDIPEPRIEPMDTAAERCWARFHQNPGHADANGVAYIFEYHQRLKHPWTERLDEAEAEELRLRAELEARQKEMSMTDQMREAIAESAARAEASAAEYLRLSSIDRTVTKSNAKIEILDERTFAARAKAAVTGIIATARDAEDAADLRGRVEQINTGESVLILIRLEELLLQRRHEASLAREAAIAAEMHRRNSARLKEEMQFSIAQAGHLLATVGLAAARGFETRFAECMDMADQGKLLEAENSFGAARDELTKTAAARPVALQIIRELRLLGYSEAPEMETLTAGDFTTTHLAMRGDEDRVVEVRCSSRTGAVSFEVCRLSEANGTATQKQADDSAQHRFCGDLNGILGAKVKPGAIQVLKDEEPGRTMKSRRATERASSAASAEAAAAQVQAMSLPPS